MELLAIRAKRGSVIHEQVLCKCFDRKRIIPQLLRISFERALLVIATLVFLVLMWSDVIGPEQWNWQSDA